MPVKEKFPWESFPYRLELKDRVAWFQCQEHMDKEIARYNLKPKDYKVSAKRGHKIIRPERKPNRKKEVVKPKSNSKKREDILRPIMKFKTIEFAKQPNLLAPRYK